MEKKEMLQRMIDFYAGGNKSEFGRILGLSPQAITAWKRRNTFDLKLIATKCTNINVHWLMTGEGEMIGQKEVPEPTTAPEPTIDPLNIEKILMSMQREVEENNKLMRSQMKAMQDMLAEAMQLMKKSQEYYERALELHEQRAFPMATGTYLAEPTEHLHKPNVSPQPQKK